MNNITLVGAELCPYFFFGGNCTMKNIKITVKSNTPSEEALKRFADKVMMIYNVSISKEKGA